MGLQLTTASSVVHLGGGWYYRAHLSRLRTQLAVLSLEIDRGYGVRFVRRIT